MSGFAADPGKPPRQPKDAGEKPDEHGPEPIGAGVPLEPGLEPELGWTADGGAAVFMAAGAIANGLTRARGGGPDDVFVPQDEEARQLGEAFARYANRHDRLRSLADKSDVAIIAVTAAQYAVREAGRAAAFREAQADGRADLDAESPFKAGGIAAGHEP